MITKVFNSFVYAKNGLKTAWREEHNFRTEVFSAMAVFLLALVFRFSFVEWMFCTIAITVVLTAEIINTAMEDLCDKVEPKYDDVIKKIKDTIAGFVLISVVGAFIIGVAVFWHHFFV